MTFDFDAIKNDLGNTLQEQGTKFIKDELEKRLNPVKVEPQPPSTQTVAQSDATKIPSMSSKTMLYVGAGIVGLLVLILALGGKSGGGRRAR